MARTRLRRVAGVLAALLAIGTATALPAAAEPAAPDLRVTASVPDQAYLVREQFPLTVTITNAGDAAAIGATGSAYEMSGSPVFVSFQDWGDLSPAGPGATIAPGETRVVELTGEVQEWTGEHPRLQVSVEYSGPTGPQRSSDELDIEVLAAGVTDTIGGIVFGDRDRDGLPDPGEALAGVGVRMYGGGSASFETTTGADGRFAVTDVPTGIYDISYFPVPDGWVIPYEPPIRVDGSGGSADLRVAAERPLSDVLSAAIEFERDSYSPGDVANLTVTLTNSGDAALSGLKAGCDRAGSPRHLAGWYEAEHWGELVPSGSGVSVEAGQTRSFAVTGIVPDATADYGLVHVACDFGPDPGYGMGYPEASAEAAVPGRTGNTWGHLFHDRDRDGVRDPGEEVAGAVLTLLDRTTGEPVASDRSDAAGRVDYTGLPVGRYATRISGPWLITNEYDLVDIAAGQSETHGWQFALRPRMYVRD